MKSFGLRSASLWFIFSRNRSSFLPATGTEQKNHGRTRFCGISCFHFRYRRVQLEGLGRQL
jgi:hypothetical protein